MGKQIWERFPKKKRFFLAASLICLKCLDFKDIKYDIPCVMKVMKVINVKDVNAHDTWDIQIVLPFNWSPNLVQFVDEASRGPRDAIFYTGSANLP